MQTEQQGLKLIKQFEGCKLQAYKCPAGIWTIGYGHTGKDVFEGQTITQEQAETLLKRDLKVPEQTINNLVTTSLTQNQFDALISFIYNVGSGAFAASTLLKKLNGTLPGSVGEEILKWTKAGGKTLKGLETRRNAEWLLFLAPK